MQLKLKEGPREWQKFMFVLAIFCCFIAFALNRKGRLAQPDFHLVCFASGLALVACLVRPEWFRGLYRAVMTGSFYVGQFMGKVILTLFFLFVITPLGLCLRGKDLLGLKKNLEATTYWRPAKSSREFDRMF